jgi:Outer membrane protein transport protein (OMPP1/FadL/TodX)
MRILLCFLLLPIFVVTSFAQLEIPFQKLSPTVFDTRAHALGKCEIMGANGSNAIFSNPAHIVSLEESRIQVGGTANFGNLSRSSWDFEEFSEYDYSNKYELQPWLSQISFSKPFGEIQEGVIMSYGVGLNKLIDLSEKNVLERDYNEDGTDVTSKYERTRTSTGGIYFLTPSVAIQIQDKLKIGITINKSVYSEMKYTYEYTATNNSSGSSSSSRYSEDGDSELTSSFISVGALYPFNEKLTLGFMYRGQTEVEVDDLNWSSTYSYSDGTTTDSGIEQGVDLTAPSMLGFGVTYVLSPKLTLLGEYQSRKWSDYEMDNENPDWIDDGKCLRLGVEAMMNNIPVRFGLFSDSILLTNGENANEIQDETPLNHTGFTYGVGTSNGKYIFEFSGEYGWINRETTADFTDDSGDEYTRTVEDKTTIFGFYASFTYLLQ